MEKNFWQAPPTTSDATHPYGLAYHIAKGTDGDTGGFTGKNPFAQDGSQFSDSAGIDSSLSANSAWRNYFADYDEVSKTDLVRKWRKASIFTNFKPPVPVADYNTGSNYAYYTNYNVIGRLEEALGRKTITLATTSHRRTGNLCSVKCL